MKKTKAVKNELKRINNFLDDFHDGIRGSDEISEKMKEAILSDIGWIEGKLWNARLILKS